MNFKPRRQRSASGDLTALNSAVAIACEDASMVILQITATAINATITVEASLDSTNGVDGTWRQIGHSASDSTDMYTQAAGTLALTAQPLNFRTMRVTGYRWARVRVSAFTSATAASAVLVAVAGPY